MVNWLRLVPQPLRGVVSTFHGERLPAWLSPPNREWPVEGGTPYFLKIPVEHIAAGLVDSLFDQLDIDEDGDVSFTGWLSETDDRVGLCAGQQLVGYLTPDDAAVMRREMQRRRRGSVHVDTFVAQGDRRVLSGTAWISAPLTP